MADGRIVITGASGKVGRLLRPRIGREGREIRLLDLVEPSPPPGEGEVFLRRSVTDLDGLTKDFDGADAVVHLGGQSREASAEDVIDRNVHGTYRVLEAARRAGVGRVILASSNHAVGFHDRADIPPGGLPADAPARPDTLYGWSKVAVESAGRLFADRFGMSVIVLRIGVWFPKPPDVRGLSLWMSPDDGGRLIEACLSTSEPGYRIVWGVSRNTRGWYSLKEGEAIGYDPRDDSEAHAGELLAKYGPLDESDPELKRVGGGWCSIPLGEPN
ncbi:NAD-dependent epimerase/dehydratase family protein [Phytomonospora endophytica]|uniref:Nucleoside-diphosphate-sugar epimerase n=1 Tax=Phytomonospora endophytica TaxID=714109 RepID=A0A841FF08_9ACTN|nr:NAD(P)-dependent oxidoreductase [Phytomonospora endophytica]MBB6034155.1 nucleoside-diphosphate-sugar epimerase [Phytomonospora endophytica]GIG66547.1 NAD-dependent dehydratase [Phytomonospora endophytica]